MMHKILSIIDKFSPAQRAHAHCDIPCGIYDPHNAQVAAHSVIRMNQLINEAKMDPNAPVEDRKKFVSAMTRYTAQKEEAAELLKKEVRILWGDYFKPEHLADHPELHDLVWKTLKLASKARQNVDLAAAEELLENVNKIAEIFWKTKGMGTMRAVAPYPTGKETVYPTGKK